MTLDPASAAVVAALITGAIHLIARMPGWYSRWSRGGIARAKTDAEIGTELRDELYREVRQLREDVTNIRETLADCERKSNLLQIDNDRLNARNNDLTEQVRRLGVEVEVLRRFVHGGG